MKIPLPRRRKKAPKLVETQKELPRQKLETLKAGRLASLALEFTRNIIETFGGRVAGSVSSQNAAEAIEEAYSEFCDESESMRFPLDSKVHSRPFLFVCFLYPFLVVLMLLGLPWIALPLFLGFLYYAIRELYLYQPLSKKRSLDSEGVNVHGILEPEGEVRQTLVFSSHHDSSPLQHYNQKDRITYAKRVLLPLALFGFSGILSLIQIFSELLARSLFLPNVPSLASLILLLLLLFATPLLLPLRNMYEQEGSPGAGDNLISVGLTVQLARYFHWRRACEKPLHHTRLIFCSFDGEEAALQGSHHWYEAMAPSLVHPLVLNFDSLYYSDHLTFLEKDVNGTQMLDSVLSRRCTEIAHSMGYEAKSESIPRLWGGTDAAQASRCGIPATTLCAVAWDDSSKPALQHTRNDVVEGIEPKTVEMALSVAIKLADLVDGNRLYDEHEPETEKPQKEEPSLVFSKLTSR